MILNKIVYATINLVKLYMKTEFYILLQNLYKIKLLMFRGC